MMDGWLTDLRYSARGLRRRPGLTATAVVTLALGIGATTTIFTVVETVLLQPPPWDEPDRLVNVWTTYPHWRGEENLDQFWDRIPLSYPEYEDWSADATLFESTAAYTMTNVTLTHDDASERLTAGIATSSLVGVLGVAPALGRWFAQGDDLEGRRVAVVSDGFWRRRFGADPTILGTEITLDDRPFTVIGVLPPGFALRNVFAADSGAHEVWLPLGAKLDLSRRGNRALDAIGRLGEGVTIEAALAESTPLLRSDQPPDRRGARMQSRREVEVGSVRSALVVLLAASLVLLLVGCLNVATMLLGEAIGRRPEISTRAALGAGQLRIVRQLLTESLLLGLLGAVLGGCVAIGLTELLSTFGPPLPVERALEINLRVLTLTSALGVGTGLLFGLAPALSLRSAGVVRRTVRGLGRSDRRAHRGLMIAEVALTVMLLVGAGLLTRTMVNLSEVDPGFSPNGRAFVDVAATSGRFTPERLSTAYTEALALIEGTPGVVRAAAVSALPLHGPGSSTSLEIEGRDTDDVTPGPEGQRRIVTPGYHDVMEIPLLEGRFLDVTDEAEAPLAMLVSETFARRYWPGRTPLGARIRYDQRWWSVVGVVGDVHHQALDEEPTATYYVSLAQAPMGSMTFVAETHEDPVSVLPRLRDAVWAANPGLVVTESGTLAGVMASATETERYRALVILLFAITATLIAAAGVFGAAARTVARRSGELGVRVAMGARVGALVGGVVGSTVAVVATGAAAGLASAALLAGALRGVLYGVSVHDPVTYAGTALVVIATATLASWVAARRIGAVDPASVLRED